MMEKLKSAKIIFLFLVITSLLFMILLLILSKINKPRVIPVLGETIFISNTIDETEGYFAYILIIDKTEFQALDHKIIKIFFTINHSYLTIIFPRWIDNHQLLIADHISSNTYFNQTVLILTGKESLLSFIWNNITT